MELFNKWITTLVPKRSNRSFTTDLRTVDIERQCVDFDAWFKTNAHLYKTDASHKNIQARKDFEKWRNGFDPIQARNRKSIFFYFGKDFDGW